MLSNLKNLLFNNDFFNPPPPPRIRPVVPNPDERANNHTDYLVEWYRSEESSDKRYVVSVTFITLVVIDVLLLLVGNKKTMNNTLVVTGSISGLAIIGALSKKYLSSRNAPNRSPFSTDMLSPNVIPSLVTATLTQAIAKAAISYYQ
ncbi:MAG: hypothetical protein K1060chlam3_00676 [Candidatus Anoxychlamydiales bacterium]|nr:hypothetical protein [Candidatus Anoxychlamydiales bacterium]